MNKLLLSLLAGVLVLAGAGCAAANILPGNADVSGDWRLAFDLPEGWAMVREYDTPHDDIKMPSQEITPALLSVIVQNTDKAIVNVGFPDDAIDPETYVTSGYTMIRVDVLDSHRVIPKNAEDLGNGFSVKDGQYYFAAENGEKYQFSITSDSENVDTARAVILSAKVVTKDTSGE